MKWLIGLALWSLPAFAQAQGTLTIEQYLMQVQSQNFQARSLVTAIESAEMRVREPETVEGTEFYASYNVFDDSKQAAQPKIMGTETEGSVWRLGLRKETSFGLGANLYFNSQRTVIHNASPLFLDNPDYNEARTVLELRQSLWRNGFGATTRNNIAAKRAAIDTELSESRSQLKNFLFDAKNVYWALVSYNQIVKLQEENVGRARLMRNRMSRGEKLRLFDDTDAMQSEAAFQSRDLELQTSLDERAKLVRQFNTLRGLNSDESPQLEGLPVKEFTLDDKGSGKMRRDDFDALRARARGAVAMAEGAVSQIRPQLDLTASFAGNGRDGLTSKSHELATTDKYPSWSVGLMFSIPIDVNLILDVKRGYRARAKSAREMEAMADFNEERVWQDLVKQRKEAFGRYQRAIGVEKIQTELVVRERRRLSNGRATTFEALSIEQGLALAQIQRVRAELAFMQIHNAIKTFEVK